MGGRAALRQGFHSTVQSYSALRLSLPNITMRRAVCHREIQNHFSNSILLVIIKNKLCAKDKMVIFVLTVYFAPLQLIVIHVFTCSLLQNIYLCKTYFFNVLDWIF